jgi:hypothetical protein
MRFSICRLLRTSMTRFIFIVFISPASLLFMNFDIFILPKPISINEEHFYSVPFLRH